jgi:hypothetical protein
MQKSQKYGLMEGSQIEVYNENLSIDIPNNLREDAQAFKLEIKMIMPANNRP